MESLYIDIGAKDKKAAEKRVKIGDVCAVVPMLQKLGGTRYAAKAFDDRIACAITVEAAKTVGNVACAEVIARPHADIVNFIKTDKGV